ncbi:MAG: hypothetical protein J7L12_01450 [Desulfurococcales archaeon]|nr:hypothetical protein [Desulfurococcales archaeon]MCD6428264.1 hypothetical protein [Desulfurococcales archaeon]
MSSREVCVRSGYRVYVGFYRFRDIPYLYGAIGFSLEEPQLLLCASDSSELSIDAPSHEIVTLVKDVLNVLGVSKVNINLGGYISLHKGLGARSRVLLSTITAVSVLKKIDVNPVEIALTMGEGRHSVVDIYTFLLGNLVIDSGIKLRRNDIAENAEPLAVMPVPREWYVVIAVPEDSKRSHINLEQHLSDAREYDLQPQLYREVVRLMSALVLRDFKVFTDAISAIQQHNDKYFTKNIGFFYDEVSSELMECMRRSGLRGIGQSLLGSTVFGFTDSYVKAIEARSQLLEYFTRKGVQGRVWVTNVASVGHHVTVSRRYVSATAKDAEIM